MLTRVSLSELEHVWNAASEREQFPSPFFMYDWYTAWSPYLAQEYTFLPLRYKDTLFPLMRKGRHLSFAGDENVTDYMDAIGSNEQKKEGWPEILQFARSEQIHTITCNNVPFSSATLAYFQFATPQDGITINITEEDTTPILSLPTEWETFIQSLERKNRHELRRKIRKFEREHPQIKFSLSHNPEHAVKSLLTLMKHDPAKQQFLTSTMEQFFQNIMTRMKTSAKILHLTDGENIIAAVLCFIQNNTLFLYNSGFDESTFSGAGFYVKALSIKFAIDTSCTQYNFLQGKERYKYELGAKDAAVYKITVTLER